MRILKKYGPYVGVFYNFGEAEETWLSWEKLKEFITEHNNRIVDDELTSYQSLSLFYVKPIRLSDICTRRQKDQHFLCFDYCPATGKKNDWLIFSKEAKEFDKQWYFRNGELLRNKRCKYLKTNVEEKKLGKK